MAIAMLAIFPVPFEPGAGRLAAEYGQCSPVATSVAFRGRRITASMLFGSEEDGATCTDDSRQLNSVADLPPPAVKLDGSLARDLFRVELICFVSASSMALLRLDLSVPFRSLTRMLYSHEMLLPDT